MKKYNFLFTFVLIYSISFAQDYYYIPTPMPALTYQQSPLFIGAGQIGTAIPMKDPLGFYLNPAQLGYFSQENTFGFLVMPKKTEPSWYWFEHPDPENYIRPIYLPTYSVGGAVGYNYRKDGNNSFSFGIGYIYDKYEHPFDRGYYDDINCLSFGLSYIYYLQFNFGFSMKQYNLKDPFKEESGGAFDFGIMITTPLSKLFFNNSKYAISAESFLKPKFDITIGYSLTNFGFGVIRDEIGYSYDMKTRYTKRTYTYPSPRTARAGYTLDFGIDLVGNKLNINSIDFSFTAEAEDLLVNHVSDYDPTYKKGMFGGIRFVDHLIKFKEDREVIVHRGNILRLFETLYFASGRYSGRGYDNIRSFGYGFSTEGIFKLLGSSIDNTVIRYISDHLVLEYYDAYGALDFSYANCQGIAIRVKGF